MSSNFLCSAERHFSFDSVWLNGHQNDPWPTCVWPPFMAISESRRQGVAVNCCGLDCFGLATSRAEWTVGYWPGQLWRFLNALAQSEALASPCPPPCPA